MDIICPSQTVGNGILLIMIEAVDEVVTNVSKKLKTYYDLTKPGIIYANAITAIAGYLFGSKWQVQAGAFLGVVAGTSLVIASACVFNNVLDRKIDLQMKRTQGRALVVGTISPRAALFFASALALLGFGTLALLTNWRVLLIGLAGFIDYIILYGWAKRHSIYSTIVGSVSGSASIMAGYVAASGKIDVAAWLLFAILALWQMPHFYSIALYRRKDYAAAGLPVMPVQRSATVAKLRILEYILALTIVSLLLFTTGYAGLVYLLILVVLSMSWFVIGVQNYRVADSAAWGKQMFLFSLIVNLGISLAVAIGSVAP